MTWCDVMWCDATRCDAMRYDAMWYDVMWYETRRYDTIWYIIFVIEPNRIRNAFPFKNVGLLICCQSLFCNYMMFPPIYLFNNIDIQWYIWCDSSAHCYSHNTTDRRFTASITYLVSIGVAYITIKGSQAHAIHRLFLCNSNELYSQLHLISRFHRPLSTKSGYRWRSQIYHRPRKKLS